jgi:hypothetical protein
LLSSVLIDLPSRHNPDRLLTIYNLILTGITVKYFLSEKYSAKKYAILAGIIMGVGFATKFNYLPVMIIPFLLIPGIKNKLIYCGTIAASFFICIIPILDKFKEFSRFISGIVSHDGLYGQGSEQIINLKTFGPNLWDLLFHNPAYSIILIISIGLVIYFIINRNKNLTDKRFIIVLQAFILASLFGFVLVSKHFKIYYFAPVLSLTGLAFYMIWMMPGVLDKNTTIHRIAGLSLLTVLVLLSSANLPTLYRARIIQREAFQKTCDFYTENVTREDLLFIEPTWDSGPFVENALVYGISYVAHRSEFYQDYQHLYPNVITWEGPDRLPQLFRTVDADPESILFSGNDIFVYSSPGRNAGQLLNYLDTLANRYDIRFLRDTVFVNPAIPGFTNEEMVIRVTNTDEWTTLENLKELTSPVELAIGQPVSPEFKISNIKAGDYLEITLCILNNDKDAGCRIIARSNPSVQDAIYFEDSKSLQDIGNGWQFLRLRGRIFTPPADGIINCLAYYPGNKELTIQDMQIRHMGLR